MPKLGLHCQAIIDGNHIDVLEIDAASNNGVDNVRQLNDAVRYAPASGRYKVYIIDEVHMLSPGAFNAFLKTLEEPPPHVKFIFATTEIRKVPITILSRCQRFDLRRVGADKLVAHLEKICGLESVVAEPEALAAIARAAEGSVRDALSLLDQAIAHGAGRVSDATVRDMLGLADRALVIDLFEAAMRGDVPAVFAGLRGAIRRRRRPGADPVGSRLLHPSRHPPEARARCREGSEPCPRPSASRGAAFASALSTGALSRAWQILLKAIPEVQTATRPLAAGRDGAGAPLPTPPGCRRRTRLCASSRRARRRRPSASSAQLRARPAGPSSSGNAGARDGAGRKPFRPLAAEPQPGPRLRRFEDVVALAGERREIALKSALERDVRLVRFEEGRIEFALAEGASRDLPNDLERALDDWTGRRWAVALSSEPGAATLHEQRQAFERERRSDAAGHPLVQAVLSRFPGAEIVDVRTRGSEAAVEAEATPPADPEADEDL